MVTASEQTAQAAKIAEESVGVARLRQPFPEGLIGKLPKAGTTLDFVGHGAVTDRLLEVDPSWTWEPMGRDEHGAPVLDFESGDPVGLWLNLTVLGVTRPGYGSCKPGQFEAVKVLIGDGIRNAAMRFGVALDLWIKGHAEDDERVSSEPSVQRTAQARPLCASCGEPLTGKAKKTDAGYVHDPDCPASQEPF